MSQKETTYYLLTGDIGGTNSRMSFYAADGDEPLVVKYFRNAEHLPNNTHDKPAAFQNNIIIPFLKHCWQTASLVRLENCNIIACLATAGLVTSNGVRMTNLGNLLVDGTAIKNDTTDKYLKQVVICTVINDFVAQGYGCLTLQPSEIQHLHGPTLDEAMEGPKVCVGAGTGLGECYLTPSAEGDYQCFPSEGGHVEYAPRNDLEVALFQHLSNRFESKHRISVERVVSGPGLANVYEFLADHFPDRVDEIVHKEFLQAGDEQGRVVAECAAADGKSLCRQAMEVMMNAYGCEVGSAAIKWIPTGGLFVTGGLTPKNMQYITGKDSEFMTSYLHKGRVSPLLEKIPLYAVLVEDLGVRGAKKAARMEYERFLQHQTTDISKEEEKRAVGAAPSFLPLALVAFCGIAIGMLAQKSSLRTK
jgi:glucokinase